VCARDIHKGFGAGRRRVEVLHGVDLDVRLGEMLLLVGPSGSGKTTLLCILTGLLDADGGAVHLFGRNVSRLSPAERTALRAQDVGFVFQQLNLLPTLTAQENVAVPLLIRGARRRSALRRSSEWLDRVGLGPRQRGFPTDLSGGEQQRVAIARALVTTPRFLVCDEPTASLDGETGEHVMTVLRETSVAPERCVIVVTHDSRFFPFGDRIARMRDGRILSGESLASRNDS
jgi:putative ABC transport system ATP-binding protein